MISEFDDIVYNTISALGTPVGMAFQDFFALINAVIQTESSFNPNAVSSVGAIGLMQVNPTAWGFDPSTLYDPATNIYAGAQILISYINSYGLVNGLAAYTAGPTNMLYKAAQSYAQSVLSLFSSFKQKVTNLFSTLSSGGEYFVNSQLPDSIPQISTDVSQLPPLDSVPSASIPDATGYVDYTMSAPAPAEDYTSLLISGAVVLILLMLLK